MIYCSFCGKSQHEVRQLIAGPGPFICDECVDMCYDISHPQSKLPPPPQPELKLCKDCRWASSQSHIAPRLWVCRHISATCTDRPDLVTGESKPPWQAGCQAVRAADANPRSGEPWCGPDGRFWESREEAVKFSGVVGFGEAISREDD